MLELEAVWSDQTAQAVALERVRLRSLPFEVADYRAAYGYGWLQVGDGIAVTDAGAYWNRITGVVVGRGWDGTAWRFLVAVDEDIATQPREAA